MPCARSRSRTFSALSQGTGKQQRPAIGEGRNSGRVLNMICLLSVTKEWLCLLFRASFVPLFPWCRRNKGGRRIAIPRRVSYAWTVAASGHSESNSVQAVIFRRDLKFDACPPSGTPRRPRPRPRGADMKWCATTRVLPPDRTTWAPAEPRAGPPVPPTLHELLARRLVLAEDWADLPEDTRTAIIRSRDVPHLLAALVEHGLLTGYQATRIDAGKAFGLVLGNYRVLERLGAGGMGVVFKAEHVDLRRPVAVKVLPLSGALDPRAEGRFLTEMRVVARLQHPNIVAAMDAGQAVDPTGDAPPLRYFVMELVAGQDLEEYVPAQGPLPVAEACNLIYQAAAALAEAHKHHLVHRDIKPSNLRVTPDGQVKLLDFGLARHGPSRLTEPGTLLGTL